MTASSWIPTYEEVFGDLEKIRTAGVGKLRRLTVATLAQVARLAEYSTTSQEDAAGIRLLLKEAVSQLGGGSLQESAEYLLGLYPGTQLWALVDRRREAALLFGVTSDTFRKTHEKNLLGEIAEQVLEVHGEAKLRQSRLEIQERRHPTDSRLAVQRQESSAADNEGSIAAPVASPDTDSAFLAIQEAFRRFAEILDEPSDHYPQHLVPSRLAEALSLSSVPEAPPRFEVRAGEHYMNQFTYGGKPILEVLAEHRRLVVLGNPGGGKTTALTAGVLDRLQEGVPSIFVRLSQVAREYKHKPRSLSEALEQVTTTALADAGVGIDGTPSDISLLLQTDPSALIALDGLDEVQAGDYDRVISLLRMLSDFPGTLVVSSRWAGYHPLRDDWEERCVDNLLAEEANKFFKLWFGTDNLEGLARAQAVLSTPSKAGLGEIPVLLGIVAAVAGEGPVPQAEAQLYARYVSLFLEGKWKPIAARVSDAVRDKHLQAARALAWAMATGMTGLADGTRWESVVTRASVGEYLRATEDCDLDMVMVAQLIRGHGLLVPIGRGVSEDYQKYVWFHRTVHEHLVGGFLLTRYRAHESALGLPVEVLGGAAQWKEPLRHFFGLLRENQQAALLEMLESWGTAGDPGWVFTHQVEDLALDLPVGHSLRVETARRRTSEKRFYVAANLDAEVGKENLISCLARNAPYDEAAFYLHANLATLPDSGMRELVAALHAATDPAPELVENILKWYSKWDSDDALKLFAESGLDPYSYSGFPIWGSRPSASGITAIAEIVAAMNASRRVRWIQLLLNLGSDLSIHVLPVGPLAKVDVEVAEAFLNASEGPWDASIKQAVLAGTYGDESVFEYAELLDADGSEPFGEVALLAIETSQLNNGSYQAASEALSPEHLDALRSFSPDDLIDVHTARRLVATAAAISKNPDPLSVEWYLQVHQAIGVCEAMHDSRGRKKQYREVLQAITGVVMKVLEDRRDTLVDEILSTDPQPWVSQPQNYGYFEIVKLLWNQGRLDTPAIVKLILWAGTANVQILHYIRMGSEAPEIIESIWETDPRVLAVDHYQMASQLAEVGAYTAWRERIVAAIDELDAEQRQP